MTSRYYSGKLLLHLVALVLMLWGLLSELWEGNYLVAVILAILGVSVATALADILRRGVSGRSRATLQQREDPIAPAA
jgi:hypothetical protein